MYTRRPLPSMRGHPSIVRRFGLLVGFIASFLAASHATYPVIGPVTDLTIVNAVVKPDGFSRQYDFLPIASKGTH